MTDQDEPTTTTDLRKAAALLRDLAAKAVEGPWRYSHGSHRNDYDKAEVIAENGGWIVAASHAVNDDSFRWIAALSPAVAEPLAAWLDSVAEQKEDNRFQVGSGFSPYPVDGADHALAFARALLTHTTGKATT